MLAALRTVTWSPPAACVMRTTTGVDGPVQPARTVWGSICSEKVSVMVSPRPGWPATPAFVVCTLVPEGRVLSTVTLKPPRVTELVATSVAVIVYAFAPSVRAALAVTEALR